MKYLLYLYQKNGCDYTIACGYSIREFEVESIYQLKDKVKEIIDEYSRDQIDEATLFQVNHKEEVNLEELHAEDDAKEKAEDEAKKEVEEKAQLAELKKKYPDLK